MAKMNTKSRTIFGAQGKVPTSKPKSYHKVGPQLNQSIVHSKNEVDKEAEDVQAKLKNKKIANKPIFDECQNAIYVSQLQELIRYFSSIEKSEISQYGINFIRDLAKCESKEKAKEYALEVMS